ncbi:unnamed protein product [Auanema sp. JU1783]|nr:unnamed protein product [Auanema sp. JU1783]
MEVTAHQITPDQISTQLHRHEKIINNMKSTKFQKRDWNTIPQSDHARNTVNPIRKIADAMNVETNPNKPLIKLSLGDPSISGILPTSAIAEEAIRETVESHKYDGYGPAVGDIAARQAVVTKYSTTDAPFAADDVILASGCSHALQMAIEGLANGGDNILVPHPGFPLYSTLCRPHGIEDRAYQLDMMNGGLIDLDHLESLIDERTKAIIINNPGNPTGVVMPREHLEDVLQIAARHKVVIIADEIYGDLVYDGAEFCPMSSLSPKVPIITCDGIAKRWMAPGWRLGWLIVHNRHGVLSEVKKGLVALSQKIVGPCSIVQGALPKILLETPESYFEYNRSVISRNAKIITNALKNVPGIRTLRPQGAMYLMVGIDKSIYGDDLVFSQKLARDESLIVLPGGAFSVPGWIRLVITYPEDIMVESAHRIQNFCASLLATGTAEVDSSDEGCDISSSDPEI